MGGTQVPGSVPNHMTSKKRAIHCRHFRWMTASMWRCDGIIPLSPLRSALACVKSTTVA